MTLSLLMRQAAPDGPPGWDEMLVGYDFSLLVPAEIQDWVRALAAPGEAGRALAALEGEALLCFERALWTAVQEATGKIPRPGSLRWARAQDRWRVALLKEALATPADPEALAARVVGIYEAVGCPEDMLGLLRRFPGASFRQATADRAQVAAFIRKCEA